MIGLLRRASFSAKRSVFNLVGKNPYAEGTSGSYFWKLERGKRLSAEEQRKSAEFEEHRQIFRKIGETLRSSGALLSELKLSDELIANLPSSVLDELKATECPSYGEKMRWFLVLASYRREHTAVTIAFWAVVFSTAATVISVATLAVAVFTLRLAIMGS